MELNLSFEDQLAGFAAKFEAEAVAYFQPIKWTRFWTVLVPEGWIYQGNITEWWYPEGKDEHWVCNSDTILHGHDYNLACRNWDYCHVYGYKPTGAEGPNFQRNFYKKWGYAKDDEG